MFPTWQPDLLLHDWIPVVRLRVTRIFLHQYQHRFYAPSAASVATPSSSRSCTGDHETVRYPLLMLNLVLWFLGLLLFVTGVSLYVYSFAGEDDTDVLSSIDRTSAIFTRIEIVVSLGGMSLFVVSFCGCVGALRENRFLLQLYSNALTTLIAVNVVFAVVVFYVPGTSTARSKTRVTSAARYRTHAAGRTTR
ncbi:tetraspanin-14-like isoform X2 [Dermacentor variabilis]|uniref:tetraspanin-14-like isoform X2 n=1 Tax=Dermacentor variabilis TaxID=34621 RepID=UPI003F5B5DED